ncbi:MAG: orotate phosphoribosyltransferase [Candidatus Asgardarchaeia archaeon]
MNQSWMSLKKSLAREISLGLADIGSMKFGDFTLTSGKWSPFYLDLRIVPSFPSFFDKVTDCYVDIIKNEIGDAVDRIAGVLTAGVPIATLVSYKLKKPLIYVRRETKAHGARKQIEGILNKDDKVVVIDDLVTSGGSVLDATKAIRNNGAHVEHVVVLIDRQQGAKENLSAINVKLHSLMTVTELVTFLYNQNKLSKDKYDLIMDYLRKEQGEV